MRLPKYRKHSSGQARVTICQRDFLLGPYGSKESKRRYNQIIAEWISSERSETYGRPKDELTVTNVLAAYHRYAKQYYGEGSGEFLSMELAMRPLRKLYGPEEARSIGPVQWKAVRQTWLTKDCSRQYANKQTNRLLRIFKWAASEGLIPTETYAILKLVEPLKKNRCNAREAEPVLPIDEATVEKTMEKMRPIVRDMVKIQLLSGCRPGEVCAIKPSMVDRSGDVWEVNLGDNHKTAHKGKSRVIYLGPKAQAILLPYLLRGADDYCFSPKESERDRRAELSKKRVTPLSCGNRPGSYAKKLEKQGRESSGSSIGSCFTT